jgi:hypothetical protein
MHWNYLDVPFCQRYSWYLGQEKTYNLAKTDDEVTSELCRKRLDAIRKIEKGGKKNDDARA